MKAHLVLRLASPIPGPSAPHWEPFILNKEGGDIKFGNSLDKLFAEQGLPFWITAEYQPAAGDIFSGDELESGFHRTYRIILRERTAIPTGLVDQIREHPEVDWVQAGAITKTELSPYIL